MYIGLDRRGDPGIDACSHETITISSKNMTRKTSPLANDLGSFQQRIEAIGCGENVAQGRGPTRQSARRLIDKAFPPHFNYTTLSTSPFRTSLLTLSFKYSVLVSILCYSLY